MSEETVKQGLIRYSADEVDPNFVYIVNSQIFLWAQ